MFGTLLYDTFCVENCVTFGGGRGGVKTCDVIFSKIVWRTKSAKVCICVSSVLVMYMFYSEFFFLIKSESSHNGSKVKPVAFPYP